MKIQQENSPNFRMLKKSKLTKLEKVFAETFKAPLEKMNKPEDLHKWSDDSFIREAAIKAEDLGTRVKLDLWSYDIAKNLENIQNGKLWKYIIFSAIKKTDIFYPIFKPEIIKETIRQISQNVDKNGDRFNFMKVYETNLRNHCLSKYFPDENRNGWVKFSKNNANSNNPLTKTEDEQKTEELIEDIRNLSLGTNWCIKSKLYASICLDVGDLYILIKDGKPVLAVRVQDNKTYEIKNKINGFEYNSHKKDIETLLKQYPKIKFYRDNVGMLDNF